MDRDDLLAHLRQLETAMHSAAVRRSVERLDALLHDAFREVGMSGHSCDKPTVLARLPDADESGSILSQDFELAMLGEGIALLGYRSAFVDDDGGLSRYARRTSVWVRDEAGAWRLRFHQGTPTDAFEKTSS
ncbi:nuclear transport factor 2 family protein [Salinisphaera sp. PC39]|uniref:nuclear transport factor 2 family protein n=1 Tax=Salinisphaera sp. PC39 TaxID=1304156 RepID=UPI0033425B4B